MADLIAPKIIFFLYSFNLIKSIAISLAIRIIPIGKNIFPEIIKANKVPITKTLSAIGSNVFPKLETQFHFLDK